MAATLVVSVFLWLWRSFLRWWTTQRSMWCPTSWWWWAWPQSAPTGLPLVCVKTPWMRAASPDGRSSCWAGLLRLRCSPVCSSLLWCSAMPCRDVWRSPWRWGHLGAMIRRHTEKVKRHICPVGAKLCAFIFTVHKNLNVKNYMSTENNCILDIESNPVTSISLCFLSLFSLSGWPEEWYSFLQGHRRTGPLFPERDHRSPANGVSLLWKQQLQGLVRSSVGQQQIPGLYLQRSQGVSES